MFFYDAISLVTFGDFDKWNPMAWYTRTYYPNFEVAPFTLGPIAESAVWGGIFDLVLKALINGLFFAFLMRWFIRYRDAWWGVTVYVYCFATCVLTLKYTVLLDLTLIEKNVVPTLLIVYFTRRLYFARTPSVAPTVA